MDLKDKLEAINNNNWQAKSDLHTLIEAREIKADPKRLKAALDMAEEKLQAIVEIIGAESCEEGED
jgi:hypothetical protein